MTTDKSLVNTNLNQIFSFIDNSVSLIEEQSKKIACLSEQVIGLSEDNRKLKKDKIEKEDLINQLNKTASFSSSSANKSFDSSTIRKAKNIINQLNQLGFIKSASINDQLTDNFLKDPTQLLDVLGNMSDVMIDLGLADNSMEKQSSYDSSYSSFSPVDFLQVNPNTSKNQKSNTPRINLAASEYESNLRNKIANENQQREEVFLKTFNK